MTSPDSSAPSSPKTAPDAPEVIEVETRIVACDGSGDALGHPRVYLNLGTDDTVECPYCDRLFVLKPGAGRAGGH
jgi:uncharacterized Zn-finger protein